uniref:Wsv267-like protein n=1 Tax=Sesarmops intermedium nimavirus TaxID=2133796 RepID=A0A401IPQ2_9VIRU|nr:MAG: wsv267-like protein [Sesarmops intermedium nimavirus]GBG35598.1 wsv267-like protein [Sesarmops intermedium nimavirus]
MISSVIAMGIASNIQKCNARIVNMQQQSIIGCAHDSAAAAAAASTTKIETGCVVVIIVSYQQLLKALNVPPRKKMKPCLTMLQNAASSSSPPSFLTQAELVIDKMLVANCSSCNTATIFSSEITTTDKGDQPLSKKSGRYVYLNDNTCVEQTGVYYGHYFVPDKKGKLLGWFSSPASAPKQHSARLCCLLNSMNLFIGDGNGFIKDFEIMNNPPKRDILGPLGQNCIKQCELEEPGPVLVFVKL